MNIEQTLWNPDDAELIGSRVGRLTIANQPDTHPDDDSSDEETNSNVADEPTDEDSDPTEMSDHGAHEHNQGDNYALGGHVTRSGSV